MVKPLLPKLLLLVALICAGINNSANAQCTPRALPFTENFSVTPFAACTPTVGGWTATSAASGAGWWLPNTNWAGGSVPEVEAYGDQANGGQVETIRLKSPPLNTIGAAGILLSFKHNLYLTNSAASGPGLITISVEYSQDSVNWSQAYSNYYYATASLTSVVAETRNININGLATNATYLRFSISGVLFKVWGWEIDNINVSVTSSTSVPATKLNEKMIYHNSSDKTLIIEMTSSRAELILQDALGNIVYRADVRTGRNVIDVSRFSKGLYIVRVANESGAITKKLVFD
jgi:hypothetical protein